MRRARSTRASMSSRDYAISTMPILSFWRSLTQLRHETFTLTVRATHSLLRLKRFEWTSSGGRTLRLYSPMWPPAL